MTLMGVECDADLMNFLKLHAPLTFRRLDDQMWLFKSRRIPVQLSLPSLRGK